mmetsp:Transcript_3109/g.5026  ORF Transcript_3109/g.5026 Transcript_3109/m.5026 type:complete len:236 (+) Transcript_3109:627-1334(+)
MEFAALLIDCNLDQNRVTPDCDCLPVRVQRDWGSGLNNNAGGPEIAWDCSGFRQTLVEEEEAWSHVLIFPPHNLCLPKVLGIPAVQKLRCKHFYLGIDAGLRFDSITDWINFVVCREHHDFKTVRLTQFLATDLFVSALLPVAFLTIGPTVSHILASRTLLELSNAPFLLLAVCAQVERSQHRRFAMSRGLGIFPGLQILGFHAKLLILVSQVNDNALFLVVKLRNLSLFPVVLG